MNTPAHVLFNIVILGKRNSFQYFWAILCGAILPDIPMILFYLWEKIFLKTPEILIWTEKYFENSWQNFFDIFNSIPIFFVGLLGSVISKTKWGMYFFSSLLFHTFFDFPLHREEAHRNFFPFSEFRFVSPISYWDQNHYGRVIFSVEVTLSLLIIVYLLLKLPSKWQRIATGFLAAFYVGTFVHFMIMFSS